jgi:TolB-like protein
MNSFIRFFILILLLSLSPGCIHDKTSAVKDHKAGSAERYQLFDKQRYVYSEPLLQQESTTNIGNFNAAIIFLADQLERNVERSSLSNTFLVTSFTNLNNISETSSFGRLMSENMMHELQVRKWQVFDIRLAKDILVNETGEFSLSRDVSRIKDAYTIGGVITGTYTLAGKNIIVNARVIDINHGTILSSAQVHLRLNNVTEALLKGEGQHKAMKIVSGSK